MQKNKKIAASSSKSKHEIKIYGLNACLEIFKVRPNDIIRVYTLEARRGALHALLAWCASKKKAYHIIPSDEMERVSGTLHHEGVCIICKLREQPCFNDFISQVKSKKGPLSLIFLVGVENPHNFGAIVRVAAHFGVAAIFVEASSKLSLSGAVHRVAEGGLEHVPIITVEDINQALNILKSSSFNIVATAAEQGKSIFKHKFNQRSVLLFGSEALGLTPQARRLAHTCITVPGVGNVQSLNVACSCATIIAEYCRQTGHKI